MSTEESTAAQKAPQEDQVMEEVEPAKADNTSAPNQKVNTSLESTSEQR